MPSEQQQQWDKERQFKDQQAAFQKREAELEAQIAGLKDQKSGLDPETTTFETAVDVLNQATKELAEVKKNNAKLSADLAKAETERVAAQTVQQQETGNKFIDKLTGDLDVEYGVEHHNAAMEAAEADWQKSSLSKQDEKKNFIYPDDARRDFIESRIRLRYAEQARLHPKSTGTGDNPTKPRGGTPPLNVDPATGGTDGSDLDPYQVPEGNLKDTSAELTRRLRVQEMRT